MVSKPEVRKYHFTVDPQLVVELARQAYWMESRKQWALDTLGCFQGISPGQIEHILNGTASLSPHPDGIRAIYKDSPDPEWRKKLAEHLEWVESRMYLFGDRRVPKELVDNYVNNIVKRLRNAMMFGGLRFMDPFQLLDLERRRQKEHNAIFLAAGFTKAEIELRTQPTKWSPEFTAFDEALTAHLDKETDW